MTALLFALFALTTALTYWLRHINLAHLKKHGATVPAGFDAAISEETLAKTVAYTFESSRLGLWESLFDNLLLVLFLFAGLLAVYDRFIAGLVSRLSCRGCSFSSCSPGCRQCWRCRSPSTAPSWWRPATASTP